MTDDKVSFFDLSAEINQLKEENKLLRKDLDELKAQNAPENWQELILYRPLEGDGQKPIEVLWTDEETEKTRIYYRTEEPMRRNVIGLVRRVK
ncbi:MAG: hypothetical protein H8D23_16545 [Candidatus Brocadiales bacterium]|nr:hypothetical protein [Candidatus Brocadiales bacterium]